MCREEDAGAYIAASATNASIVVRTPRAAGSVVITIQYPFGLSAQAYQLPEPSGIAWLGNGGEIGDTCERSAAIVTPSDFPFMVQRSWSNRAAFTGVDPCQPSSDPFVAAVPALPNVVASVKGTTPGEHRADVPAREQRRRQRVKRTTPTRDRVV